MPNDTCNVTLRERAASGVLFVCLGNICRSPLAEVVARERFVRAGLALPVDSAGVGDWHVGHQADPRAREVARLGGYDLEPHRARQVRRADFAHYGLIIGMDASNVAALEALRPEQGGSSPELLLEIAGLGGRRDVADPYFGDEAGFVACLHLLEQAIDALTERLLA